MRDKLSRKQNVLLYVIALLDNGSANNGLAITPDGKTAIRDLLGNGFKPTEQEINNTLQDLLREGYIGSM